MFEQLQWLALGLCCVFSMLAFTFGYYQCVNTKGLEFAPVAELTPLD